MLSDLVSFILHIDIHLQELTAHYGFATYALLFAIIFAETGFVITPFLPGDSLLFAAGAIAALGSLNIFILISLLIFAAIIGDTANYWIGHFFGQKLIQHPKIPINQAHLDKTHAFFKKHGGKAIILSRFVPIVRTFAPFVAGIGAMNYPQFIRYNFIGGIIWVLLFTLAGYFFGNLPAVKHNFTLVIFAIIALSLVPMLIEYLNHKKATRKTRAQKTHL